MTVMSLITAVSVALVMFSMTVLFTKFNMSLMYDMPDYVADVLDDRDTS
jgi:hypothetical protein